MPISRDTPYRDVGPVSYERWHNNIAGAGGRAELASRNAWIAAGNLSGVLLRILNQESSYDTDYAANSKANNNPYNIRVPDRSNEGNPRGYVAFPNLVEATDAARRRISGEAGFFEGPNPYATTVTIADLLTTYAPPAWNDTEGLIKAMVRDLNAWLPSWSPPVTTPSTPEEPIPVSVTFGRVPHPSYQQRIITNSTAWNDLGKRTIRAVVWHRMYGTLWGTDGYFRGEASGRALTDYGVGVEATDGASQAGVILQWNDPNGRRAPWASGPVSNPIGDGAKFVDLYGVNGVNRDAVSIEISGESGGTPLDAKARAAVVTLTAYYADQYKVPWDSFPAVPNEGRSFVMWHGEIYDGKRQSCPGTVVMNATDGMIAEVKALLQRYQTTDDVPAEPPAPPVYATPQKPKAGDSIVNDRIFLAHSQQYTLKQDVTPRVYADPGSDPTGPDLKKGVIVQTSHVVSDVGESADLTAVLVDGSRIPIKGVLV